MNKTVIADLLLKKIKELTEKEDVLSSDNLLYDYGIYGEDIFDLVTTVNDELQVDFSGLDLSQYFPDEGYVTLYFILLLQKFGINIYSKYPGMTVEEFTEYLCQYSASS